MKEWIKCYYCNKPKYIKKDCRKYKRVKTKTKIKKNSTTVIVFYDDVAIVYNNDCVNLVRQVTTWVANSTISYHVTP
jgi:hypothetical protein